jgi:hypothetical protein
MRSDILPSKCIKSVEDEVDLIQHLLDTDLIEQHPELWGLAYKFITEGLCYEVGYISD